MRPFEDRRTATASAASNPAGMGTSLRWGTQTYGAAPVDRHGGDCLVQREASHAFAELIDGSDEIPARRVRHSRRFGMDALARKHIRTAR